MKLLNEFKTFLLRGNVVDLAVAVVIGAAFGKLVESLVSDMITPLIGAFGGQPDFSSLAFTINNSKFMYGSFINAFISFLIIASVIFFFVVRPMNVLIRKMLKGTETSEDSTTKICPLCISEIPVTATKCKYCASDVK